MLIEETTVEKGGERELADLRHYSRKKKRESVLIEETTSEKIVERDTATS